MIAMKPILTQLIDKKIISNEDCHLLLESNLMNSCGLTNLKGDGFQKMASQQNT